MRQLGLVIPATLFILLSGCTPANTGITGPCPTPPSIAEISGNDMQWFEDTADIVNDYGQLLLGFDEESAQTCVEDAGLTWRLVSKDGEDFLVTLDYDPQRLNAVVAASVVTEITVG